MVSLVCDLEGLESWLSFEKVRLKEELKFAEAKEIPNLLSAPTTKRCGSKIELLITVRNIHPRNLITLGFGSALKGFQWPF